jgi:hypothetical protein
MNIRIIFQFELFSLLDCVEVISVLGFQKHASMAQANGKLEEVLFGTSKFEPS